MAQQPPRTLTADEVAKLAESVGLPGVTFAQIARGESGYQVGAVGHDPGGTQGLGLFQITTHWNDDIIKKYGGAQKLLTDPYANALAAKAIYDRQGIKAWYGTKYMTAPNLHYKGPLGDVPGSTNTGGGTPSPAAPDGSKPTGATLGSSGAGDYTSLLASLLHGPQQAPQSAPVAPPSFAASPKLPQGFAPAQIQAQAQEASGATSGLLDALRGATATSDQGSGLPSVTAPQPTVAETVIAQRKAGLTAPPGTAGISPHAQLGDPVVSSKQSVGGLHPTDGLDGYPAHDFFAPAGSNAVAPVTGKVIKLSGHDPAGGPTNGPHGPLGWSVYIQGNDGKTYYLTHMGSRGVKVGQTVRAGQIIGTVADYDKYGTPSHIHMGVHGG